MDEGLINKRSIVVKTVYSDPKDVYTDEEIELFRTVVECGAPSFFRWAREGGIKIA